MTDLSRNPDIPYILAFMRFPKFGAIRLAKIHERFDSFADAWRASKSDLLTCEIHPNLIGEFVALRPTINPDQELEKLKAHELEAIPINDPRYPSLLREIHDPPFLLFVRGSLPQENERLISIVGSRKITTYGQRVIETLVPQLIEAGLSVVSGLALGCDGLAHHHSVEAGGKTYGILAGGCDWASLSPGRHRNLASRMIGSGGGVMSEFPIGTPSLNHHFPIRNRLIAGMTKATLVIEATEKSGSLITARLAVEQNREVLAVPGPITSSMSAGPHKLIRQGAHVVTSINDIFEALQLEPIEGKLSEPIEPQNANEVALLKHLGDESMHVDDLVMKSQLPAPLVLQTLTALELRDGVMHTGGNKYRLR